MRALIQSNQKLKGHVNSVSSKSFTHRAIICACLASGTSKINNSNLCDDTKATINAFREFISIEIKNNDLIIAGGLKEFEKHKFFMNESASSLRFLLPVLTKYNKLNESHFILEGSLSKRPLKEYQKLYKKASKKFDLNNNILSCESFPDSNFYEVDGFESSQYITGIIFYALTRKDDTTIIVKNIENSIKYVDETIAVINEFGGSVKRANNSIFVIGNKKIKSTEYNIPSDLSFNAFYKALNLLGSNIVVDNLVINKNDPDYDLYNNFESYLEKDSIDFSSNPDMVMPYVVGALSKTKETKFEGISKLVSKESDRLYAITYNLEKLGCSVVASKNSFYVAPSHLKQAEVDTFNDHRICFMLTALSTIVPAKLNIYNYDCFSKSCPSFLDDMRSLGLCVDLSENYKNLSYEINGHKTSVEIGKYDFSALNKECKKVIITDSGAPENLINNILKQVDNYYLIKLDNIRDNNKSVNVYNKILAKLTEAQISKSDYIIGFGGGSILDLSSFVAMTYKRGCRYVSVPTTLLAQVDACIGGKNALNVEGVKNIIGGFYEPDYVFINYDCLDTLSYKDKISGLAEIIKIFALTDANMFYEIYDNNPNECLYKTKWIEKAIEYKINYVLQDYYDKSTRHALNFGHSVGHSVELNQNISHGEAVAYGMSKESNNTALRKCLIKYGYNLELDDKNSLKSIKNDKKINEGKILEPKLIEIGSFELTETEVDE